MLFHTNTLTEERETHKNNKEKNIKKQFNYMFTFFVGFSVCECVCASTIVQVRLPDCERLIFFLMLVFDVFFLFASVALLISAR